MSKPAHDHPDLGPSTVVEVGDRAFAYVQPDGSWYINNTGFVVGEDRVVAIDTCSTEKRTRAFHQAITEVTTTPINVLANTHHHGDHTYGNSVLDSPVIVGHERCRSEILADGLPSNSGFFDPVEWGDIVLAPPNVTFSDSLRLWVDDRPLEMRYVGQSAHTSNDCLVWLPEQEVLYAGDLLFNGGTPFTLMGSVTGLIAVLTDVVAAIPAKAVVPGHGAPGDLSLIPPTLAYLNFVLDNARSGLAAGLAPLDVARDLDLSQHEFGEWGDRERIVGNLHRAYNDLDPAGHPIDIVATLTDMVTYNGGKPLSCYA